MGYFFVRVYFLIKALVFEEIGNFQFLQVIITQFKNTSANYTELDIKTKRLMLLPVDWENILKRLHMMNKII